MEQPQSRYHGKVRVQTGDTVIEINVFDDNQEKVYLEVQKAIAQFSRDIKPATAAQREISRAEQAAAARTAAPPAQAPKPAPKQEANAPLCLSCGEECKLVRWTDKASLKAMSRYKCSHCDTWAPR
jgi:hypothetical protein